MRRMKTSHRIIRKPRTIGLFLSVLLLSSCATTREPSAIRTGPKLPAGVSMNKAAGCGRHLIVMVRLGDGAELPFLVDTGSPMTLLDKSLEPRLGPCLGTDTLWNFGARYHANRYAAPRLYLGNTRLVTDSNALTSDFLQKTSAGTDQRVLGVLGMDCLQHYCIQLDFQARQVRFLDPDRVRPARLGKTFALTFSSEGNSYAEWIRPFIHHSHLAGTEEVNLLIDTGYDGDGALEPVIFRRKIREHTLRVEADANDNGEPKGAYLPECVWDGQSYTDLVIGNGRNTTEYDTGENLLGLRFLARHLVTLDFPRRTMYLKRTSSGPVFSRDVIAAARAAERSAYRPARKLMRNGQLPGWSKRDRGEFTTFHFYPDSGAVTLDARKTGDPSIYRYEFARQSKDAPWRLRKAWRTDQDDRTMEEFPIP